jgi:hypothetical protein
MIAAFKPILRFAKQYGQSLHDLIRSTVRDRTALTPFGAKEHQLTDRVSMLGGHSGGVAACCV